MTASGRLTFRLPGDWLALDPREEDAARALVAAAVVRIVGSADDAALARRALRARLVAAVQAARDAGAYGLFLCLEIAPGVAVPASLSVHLPEAMRMSPAVGTDPERVIAVLEESFRALGSPGIDTAERLSVPGSSVLRVHRIEERLVEEDARTAVQRTLRADYWYAVPGTKQVALAEFASPLGDIPHALLNLFDSIVRGSSFAE